jgi:hypothetical protein
MYDEQEGLFSFSTKLHDGHYINDFRNPAKYRYSINTIAGLQRAKKFHKIDWDVDNLIENFLKNNSLKIQGMGDAGLLLYVLSVAEHNILDSQARRVMEFVNNDRKIINLPIQDICWLLLGLTKYYEVTKESVAGRSAHNLYSFIIKAYGSTESGLPFHSTQRCRRLFVSFGGIAYYLQALYEFGNTFGNKEALDRFTILCRVVIDLQGEDGGWAWFYNVRRGQVEDWYQLYSVHQHSMSMLFLFPALDLGLSGIETSIAKSYRWLFSNNDLHVNMIYENPFFIYRSIKRKENYEREKRFIRSTMNIFLQNRAEKVSAPFLELNRECRSYELGWLLFAWAGRNDFSEFTNLNMLS